VGQFGYRPALDGIRALAITPVIALHAFGWPHNGSLGVDLFFVLSGFLITTLLLEERLETGSIALMSFYRRRAARLVPGLLVMVVVFAVVSGGAHGFALLFAATYSANIVSVIDSDVMPWSLGHLWSLAQEEQFYLVWPALLLLISRGRLAFLTRLIVLLIAAVVVEKFVLLAAGAGEARIYYAPDSHADPILVGCLAGVLFATGRARLKGRLGGPLALAAVIGCVLVSEWTPYLGAISPFRTAFALAAGLLILAVLEAGATARILGAVPLVFVGRISYGLYLWHVPILAGMAATAYDGRPARSVLAIGATFIVATTSFYLVEQPLRRRWRHSRPSRRLSAAVQPTT
jgi:peptidoglycan/LPS O-acetylase OafA/YrhL